LFAFAAAGVMVFYNLDNQQMSRIQEDLAHRKAAETRTGA
jgi:Na+/melibiose symporter-like transporter